MTRNTLVLLCAVLAAAPCFGEIIDQDSRIQWLAGIPGGIPQLAVAVNLNDHNPSADSINDDHSAFQNAIDALPSSGGVVLIPEGTYLIKSTIDLDDNVVLRGEGCAATHLYFELPDGSPCIEAVTYERGDWVDIVSGYTKGSEQVVVADPSSFSAGDFVEIQQDNDSVLMYTDAAWIVDWALNSPGQILKVDHVSGDTVHLDRPLYLTYSSELSPQIRTQGFVEFAGVENLHIKKTNPTADGSTVHYKNAAYCWVRNVHSEHTRKYHLSTSTAYRCEFRDSYFHHSYDYGGDGHGYGVSLGFHTTDCLVENNIFRHLRHSMIIQSGASGNVYGYNYSLENVQGAGETNLNQGWTPCDISLHGHYPNFNLFESNVVQEIDVADYWGPCGPGNTFLRNVTQSEGIDVMDFSHGQNVVGNVLGTGSNDLTIESAVQNTLTHGNVIDGTVEWDPSIPDHSIPVSYYLESKPSFFGDKTWPLLGADIADQGVLPAQQRYAEGGCSSLQAGPVVRPKGSSATRAAYQNDKAPAMVYDLRGRRQGGRTVSAEACCVLVLVRKEHADTRRLLHVK